MPRRGAVAERLGRGLQSLVQRFESARRLCSAQTLGAKRSSLTGQRQYSKPFARSS